MLKRLQNVHGKNIDVMNTAEVAMVRGMGVVKNRDTKQAELPAAATSEGIFFLDADKQLAGINSVYGEVSEYNELLDNIAAGEGVQLEKGLLGERFATDQVTGTPALDDYLEVGTDGLWVTAVAATPYQCGGTVTDNGHTLYIIEVVA